MRLAWIFRLMLMVLCAGTAVIAMCSPRSGARALVMNGSVSALWPMGGYNAQHTGRTTLIGPATATQKWAYTTGFIANSSPAIGAGGTIYAGSGDGSVYAINADGTLKWAFPTAKPVLSSPAIGSDGIIYIGSTDGNVYAINPDGTQRWVFPTQLDVISSPVLDANGVIYIGSMDKNLYAIKPDGTRKWAFYTGNILQSSPTLGPDGTVYVCMEGGGLLAVNANGAKKWEAPIGGNGWSSPAVDADGVIYTTGSDTQLVAINPNDGSRKWSFEVGNYIMSSPAIGTDGEIYFGADDNKVYALTAGGTKKWEYATEGMIWSSPAVGGDGVIYIGSDDGNVYALTPGGALKWVFATGGPVQTAPAVGDGTIFVGSADYTIYAIGTGAAARELHLSSPNGDERWLSGYAHDIFWSSSGIDGTVRLDLYRGANIESAIATSVENTGHFVWPIPPNQEPDVTYRVKITAVANPDISDTSDRPFTLYAPSVFGRGDWWMRGHDVRHSGRSVFTGPTVAGTKWKYTHSAAPVWFSSPAMGIDGTLYIGSEDGNVHAIGPDGTRKWAYLTGGAVWSTPAVGADGTIYVGSNDGLFYALNPDGSLKWSYTTGAAIDSSPVIDDDGIIYVGSGDMYLYALKPDGTRKWRFATQGAVYSSPALGADGAIYVGSDDGYLYAITPAGVQSWRFNAGSGIWSSPAIAADGTIYFGTAQGTLYALTSAGAQRWAYTIDGAFDSSPALGVNGAIYVGSENGNLYALTAEGALQWTFTTNNWGDVTPMVGLDGTVYIGSSDGRLYAIYPDGTLRWSYLAGDGIWSTPLLGSDGTLYFGADQVYALAPGSATLRCQPDMQVRQSDVQGYTGDDVHNATGEQQTLLRGTAAFAPVTYMLAIQNDGNTQDNFTLTAIAGMGGWLVRYFNAITGIEEITEQITEEGGWTVTLEPGAMREFRVVVEPDATVPDGASCALQVQATSAGTGAVADVVKIVTSVGTPVTPLSAVSLSADPTTCMTGTQVTITAKPVGGKTVSYEFWLRDPQGAWKRVQGFMPNATYQWRPTQAGEYQWVVYALESNSIPVQTVNAILKYTVTPGVLSGVSLTASPQQPTPLGPPITVTAVPSYGLQVIYEFWLRDPQGNWTKVQNFSPKSSRSWCPTMAGNYRWAVYARETDGNAGPTCSAILDYAVPATLFTGVTCTATPETKAPVGQQVTITAMPQGGASVTYEFWLRDPQGAWTKVKNFSPTNTYGWQSKIAGQYQWVVYAYDTTQTPRVTYSVIMNYTVTPVPLSGIMLVASPEKTALAGTPITITATPAGGLQVVYEYWLRDPQGVWTRVQGYGTNNHRSWQPTVSGAYQWAVYAREVNDPAIATQCTVLNYTITTGPLSGLFLRATPEKTSPLGATIPVTAFSAGGQNVVYEFWLRDPQGSWTKKQNFSSNSTCTWQPTAMGSYQWAVYAHETTPMIGKNYSVVMDYTITAAALSGVTLATTPVGSGAVNSEVQVKASATGGTKVLYEFWLRDPQGVWTKAQGYKANATLAWIPPTVGQYQWVVYVVEEGQPLNPKNCAGLNYTAIP